MINIKKISLKNRNSGFTLVELLIAVSLVAVVGTAVFGFMTVGARTFTNTSSDVNLQSEAQLAFNQMQDIIIDTTVKIEYYYAPSGAAVNNLASYLEVEKDSDIPVNCAAKKLVMYNYGNAAEDKRVYELTWERDPEPSQSKLYYTEYNSSMAGDEVVRNGSPITGADHVLMSEYIADFRADLTRLDKRIVRIETLYEKGNKQYTSSHNITLRNKQLSANEIASYTDTIPPEIPEDIIGPTEIYLMPGESLQLTTYNDGINTGYVVKYPGHPLNPPYGAQDIKFSLDLTQSGLAAGTGVSASGLLTIGKGQGELMAGRTFKVKVSTDFTLFNVSKDINVHIIRVTNIAIDATPLPEGSTPIDETGEGWRKNLIEDESFKLKATVTVENGDKISATGNTLDRSVVWTKTLNGDLFTLTDLGGSGNEYFCTCKMIKPMPSTGFTDFDSNYSLKNIEITATSKASMDLPYKDTAETTTKHVFNRFGGSACKRRGGFDIEFTSTDFRRGERYTVGLPGSGGQNFFNHSFNIPGTGETIDSNFWTTHVVLVDVSLTEQVYAQDGSLSEPRPVTFDTSDDEEVKGTGDSWHFRCPNWYNPNAKYNYSITLHIANGKNGDHQKYIILPDSNYSTEDIIYSSNTISQSFDRLILKYQYCNGERVNNFRISDDQRTAVFYPRSFNISKDQFQDGEKFGFIVDPSFVPYGSYTGQGFKGFEFACYTIDERTTSVQDEEGNTTETTYCVYDDSTKYDGLFKANTNESPIFQEITVGGNNSTNSKVSIRYRGYNTSCKKWADAEPHLRLVPLAITENSRTKEQLKYPLFSNYIDVYLTNISIPSDGMISKLFEDLGITEREKSYFPVPLDNYTGDFDVKFPGEVTASGAKEWRGACYGYTGKHPDTFRYTISVDKNPDGFELGENKYTLRLYTQNKKDATNVWTEFAEYICHSNEREWHDLNANPNPALTLN